MKLSDKMKATPIVVKDDWNKAFEADMREMELELGTEIMQNGNLNKMVHNIKSEAKIPYDEIKRRIDVKQRELIGGPISIEEVLIIVGKEVGLDLESKKSVKDDLQALVDAKKAPKCEDFGKTRIGSPNYGGECQFCEFETDCIEETKKLNTSKPSTGLFDEPQEQGKLVPKSVDFKEADKEFIDNNISTNPKAPELFTELIEPRKVIPIPPAIPTEEALAKKQEELDPNPPEPDKYPIALVEIIENDPLLAKINKHEVARIIQETELLNFTINSVLKPGDYYQNTPTRSGVHKIQTILNVSTEIKEENYSKVGEFWVARYKVRAISHNGRFTEAIGFCEQNEKGRIRTLHDTMATAQTRATNRAILDLVGFGAVSHEEKNDNSGLFD